MSRADAKSNRLARLLPLRRTAAIAGAALFTAAIASAFVIGPKLRSPEQVAADAAPPPPSAVTVAAEFRSLSEALVLRGTAKPGPSVKLLPPVGATGDSSVITDVKVAAGDQVREGRVIVVRAGEPMFGLKLKFAMYRTIVGGMNGPDVLEVQRALARLGYRTPQNGIHDAASQSALGRFYRDRGYQAPAGSAEAAAQLSTAVKAVQDAERAYAEAQTAGVAVDARKADLDRAESALAPAELAAGPALPRSNVLLLDRDDRRISSVGVAVGSVLTDANLPIVELDGEAPYVVTLAGRGQASMLQVGQAATILDDTDGGRADVVVSSVGTEPVNGPNGERGFEVKLSFTAEPLAVGQDRAVRIDIPAAATAGQVLAVPLHAVMSRPDGTTFVTAMPADGASTEIGIETGRIAGGWVEVTASTTQALTAGTKVVVGEQAPALKAK